MSALDQMPKHDFTVIGQQIITSLRKAAADIITEANNLQASVEVLAEGVAAQMDEHAALLNEMDARIRSFGKDVVEAHKKLINGGKHDNPSP